MTNVKLNFDLQRFEIRGGFETKICKRTFYLSELLQIIYWNTDCMS